MKPFTLCLLLLLGLALTPPAARAGTFSFGDARLSLEIDDATGAITKISAGTETLATASAGDTAIDVNLNGRWTAADDKAAFRLVRHSEDAATGTLTLVRTAGVWEVTETLKRIPGRARIARRMSVVYNGDAKGQLKGVRFHTPGVRAAGDGFYVLPRQYPPYRRAFSELAEGTSRYTSVHLSPVLAQVAPSRTLVWSIDGRTDKVGTNVKERAGALEIVQDCRALGWVEKGDRQDVGTAYLTVVDAPYEAALDSLWEWMHGLGMVVPKDRPTWVFDASLYSYHPGGTIASQFKDLGGFANATKFLLPTLPSLGVNATWIMPVEDLAVYHPRDYYKFQAGLGTPEEFRALVAKTHGMGFKVLQDLVPHGGSNTYPRALEHPEWLVRDEEQKTLGYWCFDFAWPSWQQYIGKVADHYVRNYDVDGYRVDAVGGSYIPNWSPNIPYARASFSQTPGGLGMLRSIRGAVKGLKPREGAVLAEVEGAPYAAESDMVYDFALCYSVLPDLRRTSPENFVARLKTYLHEQQRTDPKGTIRMRHVESHDSLRSQYRYGVAPAQALFALTAWIDGVPLVYQGMETGNGLAIRTALDIRKDFPELRRGEALYDVSTATPGVFTCVRRDGRNLAVVAINLNPDPVRASISLPAAPLGLRPADRYTVIDARFGGYATGAAAGRDLSKLTRALAPYEAMVVALRPGKGGAAASSLPRQGQGEVQRLKPRLEKAQNPPTSRASTRVRVGIQSAKADFVQFPGAVSTAGHHGTAAGRPKPAAARPLSVRTSPGTLVVENAHYKLTLDTATGLPKSMTTPRGAPLLGGADLFADAGQTAKPATLKRADDAGTTTLTFTRPIEGGSVTLAYRCDGSPTVALEATLSGNAERAGIVLPLAKPIRWSVDTAEGRLDDWPRPRPVLPQTMQDNIYGRPQGTDILWQERLVPLKPGGTGIAVRGADGSGIAVTPADPLAAMPEALHLLDRYAGTDGLHLLAAWRAAGHRDPGAAGPPSDRFALRITALAPNAAPPVSAAAPPKGIAVRHTGLDHVIENGHYRAVLRRTGGGLKELWALEPRPRLVFQSADIYADRGFHAENKRLGTEIDMESAVRTWTEGDALHIRFTGRLRGDYRFDLSRPAVRYYQEYVFTGGPSFRHTWGVNSGRPVRGDGFLSAVGILPADGTTFAFERGGAQLFRGTTRTAAERQGETKLMQPSTPPDTLRLSDSQGPSLSLTGIATQGPASLRNVFVHRNQLFLTWIDGKEETLLADRWYQASAVYTPGDAAPAAVPRTAWLPDAGGATGLRDSSFEGVVSAVSLVRGSDVTLSGESAGGAWQTPVGGALTRETAHTGRVSAKVEGAVAEYRLWRQPIPVALFPPGSKVRLSAWVRAKDVVVGSSGWMMGTIRIAVFGNNPTTYLEADKFTGTFDWRHVSAELTIPADAASLDVQVGLNGSPGTCWIDDVRVERVE